MSFSSASAATRPTSPHRIGIVGAGIGGLALAIALQRKGFEVQVLEKRSETALLQEGIFVTLAPNGMNALKGLGLAGAVCAKGAITNGITLHNEHGKQIGSIDYSAHANTFGSPSITIRRGALGAILLEAAQLAGISVHFGSTATAVSEGENTVSLSVGEQGYSFAALIGADGLRSTVRRLVFPLHPTPTFNGLMGSGGIVDVPAVPSTEGQLRMTFGRKAFFGYLKAGDGPVYWFDSFPSGEVTIQAREPRAIALYLQSLHGSDPLDNYAIVSAEDEVAGIYPDYDIPTLPQWHTNRTLLIGDAAHAMTPHSGQGASMALEDALVLAACLEAELVPSLAFQRFETLRRKRVEAAVALGRQSGQQKKAQSWLSLRLRDLILPLVMPLGQKAQERLFAFRADTNPLIQPQS